MNKELTEFALALQDVVQHAPDEKAEKLLNTLNAYSKAHTKLTAEEEEFLLATIKEGLLA
jgi:hypothetical protein